MRAILVVTVVGYCIVAGGLSRVEAQPSAIVTGHVTGEAGEPLHGALVQIAGLPGAVAVADSTGAFRLEVPAAGKVILQAQLLGYESSAHEIVLVAGVPTAISLTLYPAQISISGSQLPVPSSPLRAAAVSIIADLLTDPILKSFAANGGDSEVVVWVPWSPQPLDTVLGTSTRISVRSHCARCVAESVFTIEGGEQYRAGLRHIRVGLTGRALDPPSISLCLDSAEVGEVLMINCTRSAGYGTVTYRRGTGGGWIRTEDRSSH